MHNTPWEQLVLMRYQNTETPVNLFTTIRSIKDGNGRALAIQMLLSLLRTRERPPHPFRLPDTTSSSDVPPPRSTTIAGAIPVPNVPAASTPLSATQRTAQEAVWRAQIETIRTSPATLDELTPLVSTLDASPLTATVYLSLAENYASLLELQKASIAFEHATDRLNQVYQNEHGSWAVAWKWCYDKIPSVLLPVLVYVLALYHELFKKLTEHYTSLLLLRRWPDRGLAAAVGKAFPSNPILVPNGSADTLR
jgi:hypothetical protein